ncbi:hypothetical protein FI667_g7692, partial [Globisporangium splendens]
MAQSASALPHFCLAPFATFAASSNAALPTTSPTSHHVRQARPQPRDTSMVPQYKHSLHLQTPKSNKRLHSKIDYSPMDAANGAARQHDDAMDAEDDVFRAFSKRHQTERKMPLLPAHEVRYLREEYQRLQHELQSLCVKWNTALPDPRTRLMACEAAKQRVITSQVEKVNADLKEQLLVQQLFYASLQRTLLEAPLSTMAATSQAMFERIHGYLSLGTDVRARIKQLEDRFEVSFRLARPIVDSFTNDLTATVSTMVPFSRTCATGVDNDTLVSNIFICKLPNTSLQSVLEAAYDVHTAMHFEMQKRLGVELDLKVIHDMGPTRFYSQVQRFDGAFDGLRTNRAIAAKMVSNDFAVITTDFTDNDELYPTRRSSDNLMVDACSIMVLTRHVDPVHGQPYVLLRRIQVHRYNLLANSAVLFNELNTMLPYINGDLPMALLCEALQSHAARSA